MKKYAFSLSTLGVSMATAAATAITVTATRIPSAASVQHSVDALSIAGPWLGMLLIAAIYFDLRSIKKASDAKHETVVTYLNQRIETVHTQLLAASEKDASTLLALARNLSDIISKHTASNERVTETLDKLTETLAEKIT